MTTGRKIKKLRKEQGFSQGEFADLVGKSRRTIQHYEAGTTDIPIAVLKEIAEILDVPCGYLIDDDLDISSDNTSSDNLNEVLRSHIIRCVRGIDDRQTLLHMVSDVERIQNSLAEKEN